MPVYYYKKSAIQYTVLCVMAFVASSTMIWFSNGNGLMAGGLILTVVVIMLAASISMKTSMKITVELNSIVTETLDPELFLTELDKAAFHRDPMKQQPQLKLFRANALRLLGRYKESEELYLDFLKRMPKTVKDDMVKKQYAAGYASLSLLYSAAGRFETAEKAYEKAREQMKGLELDELSKQPLQFAYYSLLANNGETAEAINFYRELSMNAPTRLNRVIAHYKLGEAYAAAGYDDLAETEFRYVAENGEKLHIRTLAEEKLS